MWKLFYFLVLVCPVLSGNARGAPAGQPPALLLFVLENISGCYAAMLIVHVHVHVKPECVAAFQAATQINARLSRLETGVLTFDVLQQADAPERFVLIEIYRDAAAAAAHKETAHYPVWRDVVAEMMVEPRHSVKFKAA